MIADHVLAACPQVQHVVMAADGRHVCGVGSGTARSRDGAWRSVTKDDSIEVRCGIGSEGE